MTCQQCKSNRLATVCGKTADCCYVEIGEKSHNGYVPTDMRIGHNGDYISFSYCLDCGQIQGKFPVGLTKLETKD